MTVKVTCRGPWKLVRDYAEMLRTHGCACRLVCGSLNGNGPHEVYVGYGPAKVSPGEVNVPPGLTIEGVELAKYAPHGTTTITQCVTGYKTDDQNGLYGLSCRLFMLGVEMEIKQHPTKTTPSFQLLVAYTPPDDDPQGDRLFAELPGLRITNRWTVEERTPEPVAA